jgi:TIR domain
MTIPYQAVEEVAAHSRELVFISYRRQEASYLAAWLHDYLTELLGSGNVFLDVDSMRPGMNFVDVIRNRVGASAVLVLIIGSQWLAKDPSGRSRLDDPTDAVRIEAETALSHDVHIIPVLLDGAPMPRDFQLPASLRPITRLSAVSIRRESARRDIQDLGSTISGLLSSTGAERDANSALEELVQRWQSADFPPLSGGVNAQRMAVERSRLMSQLGDVYSECVKQALGGPGSIRFAPVLELVPAKTARPVDQLLFSQERKSEPLPSGTTLAEVLDRYHGLAGDGLLVLGEPGAGKTAMLFELALDLWARARANPRIGRCRSIFP